MQLRDIVVNQIKELEHAQADINKAEQTRMQKINALTASNDSDKAVEHRFSEESIQYDIAKDELILQMASLQSAAKDDKIVERSPSELIYVQKQSKVNDQKMKDALYSVIDHIDGHLERYDAVRKSSVSTSVQTTNHEHKLQALTLLNTFLALKKSPKVERVILGAGVAGTMVYAEIPPDLAQQKTESGLPAVIVINNPERGSQWPNNNHSLMGQPAKIQTPQVFSSRSEDFEFEEDEKRNPFHYSMTDHFRLSLLGSQNDRKMNILNLKSTRVESKANLSASELKDWEYADAKHRIVLSVDGSTRYLYTNAVDICTGPGPTRALDDKQISPALSSKLMSEGKMMYGQYTGTPQLKGNVVFYGGSARNAQILMEVLNGYKPEAKIMHWIARNGRDFGATIAATRMFDQLKDSKVSHMSLGTLSKVEELPSGQVKLTFAEPTGPLPVDERKLQAETLTGRSVVCDQLVVTIGQVQNDLVKDFKDFVPCLHDGIPVGSCSNDGSIVVWGAAGSTQIGLTLDQQQQMNDLVAKHAKSLPFEAGTPVSIYRASWTVKQMAADLRARRLFPGSDSYNAHLFDVPDINVVSEKELTDVISRIAGIEAKQCKTYAQQVIDLRAKAAEGIQSPAELNVLPVGVASVLTQAYFPSTAPLPSLQLQTVSNSMADKVGEEETKGGHAAQNHNLRFFPVVDPYAVAFVSQVVADARDNTAAAGSSAAAVPAMISSTAM